MTLKLSDEQRHALDSAAAGPVDVVDPVTHSRYVLLSAATYDRIRPLVEEVPFEVAEAYPLCDEVAGKEGWDSPDMAAYNQPLIFRRCGPSRLSE